MAHSKIILFVTALLAAGLLAVCIPLSNIPDRDMAHRYIPMAEAFASGNWEFAFHPRVPPLQPMCGGIIARIPAVDGFLGLKIASALWHFAGGVLLWLLFRTVYPDDRKVALFGTVLYFFFPYMFHMAYSGLRESAKCTLLILLALALVRVCRERSRWRDYLLLGVAVGLGSLVRVELSTVGMFCIFFAAVFECSRSAFPFRSVVAVATALLFGVGNALLNYHFFGHAMPDVRLAVMFLQHFGRAANPCDLLSGAVLVVMFLPTAAWASARFLRRIPAGYFWGGALFLAVAVVILTIFTGRDCHKPQVVKEFFVSLSEGVYYFVVPIAFLHVGRQIALRKFTRAEHAVLAVASAHILLCLLQIQIFERKLSISSRYLYPAVPVFFGFFLLGWEDMYRWFSAILPKWCVNLMLAGTIGGLAFMYVYHLPQPLYREYHAKSHLADKAAMREVCRLVARDELPLRPRSVARSMSEYRSPRQPKIWFHGYSKVSVAAYFVGGSITLAAPEADYIVAERLPDGVDPRGVQLLGRFKGRRCILGVWRIK